MSTKTEVLQAFENTWDEYRVQLIGGINSVLCEKQWAPEQLRSVIQKQKSLHFQSMRTTSLFRSILHDGFSECDKAFQVFIDEKLDFDIPVEASGMQPQAKAIALGGAAAVGIAACLLTPVTLVFKLVFLAAPSVAVACTIHEQDQKAKLSRDSGVREQLQQKLDALHAEALNIISLAITSQVDGEFSQQ